MTQAAAAPNPPLSMAVLVSGSGTTLFNLLSCLQDGSLAGTIPLVIASRECAGAERARARGIPTWVVNRSDFASTVAFSAEIFDRCRQEGVDLVVLGGFLCRIMIPEDFALRVLNIHPSLIPAFCGQGMYGHRVHESVITRGCKVSGCTVHFCDNEYDHGPIVLQKSVPVLDDDSPQTLAARVFAEECLLYPEAIRLYASGRLHVEGSRVRIRPSDK